MKYSWKYENFVLIIYNCKLNIQNQYCYDFENNYLLSYLEHCRSLKYVRLLPTCLLECYPFEFDQVFVKYISGCNFVNINLDIIIKTKSLSPKGIPAEINLTFNLLLQIRYPHTEHFTSQFKKYTSLASSLYL